MVSGTFQLILRSGVAETHPGDPHAYWSKNTPPQAPQVAPKAWAIEPLRKALDLESRRWHHDVKPVSEPNQPYLWFARTAAVARSSRGISREFIVLDIIFQR